MSALVRLFRSVRLKNHRERRAEASIHNRITGLHSAPPVLPKAFAHKNGTGTAPAGRKRMITHPERCIGKSNSTYFTMLATSAAKSSVFFSRPSPFS